MKIFLDTNVVMEFFGNRIFFEDCRRIMEAAFQGGIDACMSAGGVYTITYLLGIDLKKKNIHEPNKTEMVREMLHDLLKNYISVVDISQEGMETALDDQTIYDLEDAYQYYCAIENECDAIVTINMKHFSGNHNQNIHVFTPSDFVNRFLEIEEGKES
jgi:predicted nucleic acid-binding protein